MPDYLYSEGGMRIDGVTEGRPAANAGLRKGDVVVRMGDSTVTDIYGYMRALSVFETGDTTTVVVKRDGEEIAVKLSF
jgi:S1-C subfamily serine protease